jgi:PP-loop superfamily ATP-utilizing enzyme
MHTNNIYSILIHNLRCFNRVLIVSYGGGGASLLINTAKEVLGTDNVIVVTTKSKDKNELFKKLTYKARKKEMVLCDTANFSDFTDHPHGREIETEWDILAPLAMAGITRKEVRILNHKIKQ